MLAEKYRPNRGATDTGYEPASITIIVEIGPDRSKVSQAGSSRTFTNDYE